MEVKVGNTVHLLHHSGKFTVQGEVKELSRAGNLARISLEIPQIGQKTVTVSVARLLDQPVKMVAESKVAELFNLMSVMSARPRIGDEPDPKITPEIVYDARWNDNTGYVIASLPFKFEACKSCGLPMVRGPLASVFSGEGFVYYSIHSAKFGGNICGDCERKYGLTCQICQREITRDDIQWENEDCHLCKDCYATVPAGQWEAAKQNCGADEDNDDEYDNW